MDIGILYICTGKYKIFWESFYKSCEKYFLPSHNKHYFVFTDATELNFGNNVTLIKEQPKGFPMDSLLRFKMFNSIYEHLEKFDYLFFFNSNMCIVDFINEDILPDKKNDGLVALIHPGYYNKKAQYYPFERNPKSKAFIPFLSPKKYFYYMGSFNGGESKAFLKLIKQLDSNVNEDLNNGIIAIYHDESHLNSYLNFKNTKGVDPSYGFPEGSNIPFQPKILILNKVKHGGGYFNKLPKSDMIARLKLKINIIKNALLWKFISQ